LKQILQNLSNGETSVVDVPCPNNTKSNVLIATRNTVVSAGTERMMVDFGKANYIDKARQQPDKVKMVLNKMATDGLMVTIDAVRSKLDQPLPLGYCNAGVVLESDVDSFKAGDRVVSNGNHAEVVRVPKNLCVNIPDIVDDESAAFTVLGAIGLQGIRLLQPTIGECFVVTGLGLIGLMCVQMLRANGCRVLGVDFDSKKCELAQQFGAETVDLSKGENPVVIAQGFSRGRGVDGVLITAATKSDEVMHEAAEMCRKRGRIVLVGVVGLNLRRDDFFKKEISFQVSSSYGPGRYDPIYEEDGHDYPLGFVRWTVQRNFEAVLDMMATGTLNVKPLITHRFDIESAVEAYELLNSPSALGILLKYPIIEESELRNSVVHLDKSPSTVSIPTNPVVAFIGAGNYASRILLPAFMVAGVQSEAMVTSRGVNAVHHGGKSGFKVATTSLDVIWESAVINLVVIVTRHDSHAIHVLSALESGKNVFVEKPLALTLEDLVAIDTMFVRKNKTVTEPLRLMIGFNRRFAPHVVKMKSLLETRRAPKTVVMTINAGEIPADHWTQDLKVGGGRIVGEGCHFIDLMRFLIGHSITGFQAMKMGSASGLEVTEDKASITLYFSDGSLGTIHYFANGGKTFPKERIEVFCENAVLQMDNYRVLKGFGWPEFRSMKLLKQDKGQKACVKAFVDAIRDGKDSPIPYEEVMESSRIAIKVAESLRKSS
jgi:predicted dehydrogenase/threonine dehydrogenase-like Zn-dependent dehydrogenase